MLTRTFVGSIIGLGISAPIIVGRVAIHDPLRSLRTRQVVRRYRRVALEHIRYRLCLFKANRKLIPQQSNPYAISVHLTSGIVMMKKHAGHNVTAHMVSALVRVYKQLHQGSLRR
jgi:hypothetical protein